MLVNYNACMKTSHLEIVFETDDPLNNSPWLNCESSSGMEMGCLYGSDTWINLISNGICERMGSCYDKGLGQTHNGVDSNADSSFCRSNHPCHQCTRPNCLACICTYAYIHVCIHDPYHWCGNCLYQGLNSDKHKPFVREQLFLMRPVHM